MFSLISQADEKKTRAEAAQFAQNRAEGIETAIGNTTAAPDDDPEAFEAFRAQLHANDPAEDLENLTQDQIRDLYEEKLAIDRVKWRAFKAQSGVQFFRATPECAQTEKNINVLCAHLNSKGINSATATVEQITAAFLDCKAQGKLDLVKVSKAVDPYSISMDRLKELSGGSAEPVINDYTPDPNVAYHRPGYL